MKNDLDMKNDLNMKKQMRRHGTVVRYTEQVPCTRRRRGASSEASQETAEQQIRLEFMHQGLTEAGDCAVYERHIM